MAKQNLGLLSTAGLDQRISEISKMLEQYGKDSHSDALKSAHVLKDRIAARTQKYLLKTKVLHANATEGRIIRENIKPGLVDVIFTDVPYGQHSHWHNSSSKESPSQLWSMLDALLGVVSSSSIVAIASDKSQKAAHEGYERIEHFQVGKRRVVILKPIRITKLSSTSDG